MRKTVLTIFGLILFAFWWLRADFPVDGAASLEPVLPRWIRTLPHSSRTSLFSFGRGSSTDVGTTELNTWLTHEAERVGRTDSDPAATVVRLKTKALSLSPQDLHFLKTRALDTQFNNDQRFMAVYMIGLSESATAKTELMEIGQATVPKSTNDRSYSDEVVIRAQALESLIQRLSREDSLNYLKGLLSKTDDPAVARHARYWLGRLEQNPVR